MTIVTFSDFQCPFCSRVLTTLEEVLERYPEDVEVVFRHNPLPFHQNAAPAAELALEAYDQGGAPLFWSAHDLLFANQRQLDRASLERYAQQLGMDMDRTRRALDERSHQVRIETDQRAAARVGARGTPHFFLNGVPLRGAQPFSAFAEIIEREIGLARQLLDAGVARDALYARFMRDARTEPRPEPERGPPSTARARPDPDVTHAVPVAGRPQRGPDDALVTVVEFADLQCPFCARVQPTLAQVRQRYGANVRVVLRHNPVPFHAEAMPAAEAAEAVYAQRGADAFFQYAELLFANPRALARDDLLAYARQVGADAGEVRAALDDHRHRATILEDQQLARDLGATGTPSFFINGRPLVGAQRCRRSSSASTPRSTRPEPASGAGHRASGSTRRSSPTPTPPER